MLNRTDLLLYLLCMFGPSQCETWSFAENSKLQVCQAVKVHRTRYCSNNVIVPKKPVF
jgi:hypothetical protein